MSSSMSLSAFMAASISLMGIPFVDGDWNLHRNATGIPAIQHVAEQGA